MTRSFNFMLKAFGYLDRTMNKFLKSGRHAGFWEHRIAQRRTTQETGRYKILERDRFYGRHYDGEKSGMTLIDISTTGCAFRTKSEISAGAYVEIEISGLSGEDIFPLPIRIACEAVYCMPIDENGQRVGVKFLDIETGTIEKIRYFTEKVL